MSIENRPYIGSWRLGSKKLVQYTPDALVYINGDLALPGCQKCNSRIDIQKYLTEVSVDAGCDPGAASANFTLSVPQHAADSIIRDAQFILRAGLEVHIYMRGYFPVKGLYSNLAMPTERLDTSSDLTHTTETAPVVSAPVSNSDTRKAVQSAVAEAKIGEDRKVNAMKIYDAYTNAKYPPAVAMAAAANSLAEAGLNAQKLQNGGGPGLGLFQITPGHWPITVDGKKKYAGKADTDTTYNALNADNSIKAIVAGGRKTRWINPVVAAANTGKATVRELSVSYGVNIERAGTLRASNPNRDKEVQRRQDIATSLFGDLAGKKGFGSKVEGVSAPANPSTVQTSTVDQAVQTSTVDQAAAATEMDLGTSLLEQSGLAGADIENVLSYPYYHVFHGVVTQVSHSYSGGANTASAQCVSMLHFWQYQQMSTNAMALHTPANKGLKVSNVGNNFTAKHPYEIMYNLHNDTAGSAAGVSWAIEQKTNQNAKSSLTGEQMYSLNLKYWQKRFNTRDIKLRMHGATGEMFNAAQAAFLSKLSSNQLTALLRGRFGGKVRVPEKILSGAIAVGLGNNKRLEALLQAKKTEGKEGKGFDLSVAEMQAFVSDVGQFGSYQLFESTYESKLDIAQKVCEVTGFEFYQDVDGDFVFKPPMYNLDTSASRVYRIEDIDIVSINFEDKEPQVTYMTGKGSHWQNQKIGVENEMGTQGQYIDWRLVAQYGWRPGNFESAYITTGESMYVAAATRMDILNAPTKSASVTIPMRPELRPGYPVYIPYLDAYYYCNSFAHGFSVGGACTTSLQLIGKRSKFFAPGEVTQQGIESIHLDNTILPEKPLQVVDEAGRPKLSGFPNVVMALDPEQLDPLIFMTGRDIDKLDDPDTLEGLLKMAVQLGIVTNLSHDLDHPGPYYSMSLDEDTSSIFHFPTANSPTPQGTAPQNSFEFKEAATLYIKEKKNLAGQLAKQEPTLRKAQTQLSALIQKQAALDYQKHPKEAEALEKKVEQAQKKVGTLVDTYKNTSSNFEEGLSKSTSAGMSSFVKLLKLVGERFIGSETAILLDLLSDKKAFFSNNSVPGSYRYFSASHPDPHQQGMKHLTLNIRADKKATGGKAKFLSQAYLEPIWKRVKVPTYVESRSIRKGENGVTPDAQIALATPQCGIQVLTSRPDAPHGEVVPTSEIREVMFAAHLLLATKKKGVKTRVAKADIVGLTLQRSLGKSAQQGVGEPIPETSLVKAMEIWRNNLASDLDGTVASVRGMNAAWNIPDFPAVDGPDSIVYQGGFISTSVPMNTYRFAGDTDKIKDEAFPGSASRSLGDFWVEAAQEYAAATLVGFRIALAEWSDLLEVAGVPAGKDKQKVVADFVEVFQGKYGVNAKTAEGHATAVEGAHSMYIYSPVFPVSDARGYHVVGSYRYGRDVNIDPEGVFDVLHRQDPLQMLDKNLNDAIFRAIILKEDIYIDLPVGVNANGSKRTQRVRANGNKAKTYLEEKALETWRKNWSDQDILDRGIAKRNGNLLTVDLNNLITEKGKDGIQKLPIINAAFSLADLAPHTSRGFCSCKAAEADVLLDVAGQQNFLKFVQPGKTTPQGSGEDQVDSTVQWIQSATAAASIPWAQSQAALRGTAAGQQGSSLIQTALGLVDQYEALGKKRADQKQNLMDEGDLLVLRKKLLLHPKSLTPAEKKLLGVP